MIEEFLEGEEASFFALVDGEQVVPLIAAQVQEYPLGRGSSGLQPFETCKWKRTSDV